MKRNDWEFRYNVRALRQAVARKVKFHKGRLAHWTKEQAKADKAIRSKKGINVVSIPQTGGYRDDVQVDHRIAAALTEATRKVAEHRAKVQEFERWRVVLLVDDADYALHIDDAIYFGLAESEPPA